MSSYDPEMGSGLTQKRTLTSSVPSSSSASSSIGGSSSIVVGMQPSSSSSNLEPVDSYNKLDKTEISFGARLQMFIRKNRIFSVILLLFILLIVGLYLMTGNSKNGNSDDDLKNALSGNTILEDDLIDNGGTSDSSTTSSSSGGVSDGNTRKPAYLKRPELMTIQDYHVDFMSDSQNERRRAVREAFIHAFKGYENVWGKDEYRPVSRGYHNWIRDSNGFGMTIIDSLDTMIIMGLKEQFEKSLKYVKKEMPSFSTINGGISVFETTIRVVGGFLSAFDLSKEPIFLEKAKDMADRLIPAFSSSTGIPYSEINLRTGEKKTFAWAGNCCPLSEFGTLQLEFRRLSELTGDDKYHKLVTRIMDLMVEKKPSNGLFPIKFHPENANWCTNHVSLGALGDSFFEYLLKQWLMNRGTQAAERYRQLYLDSLKGIFDHMLLKSSQGYTYVAEYSGAPFHKVDHLACFAAGMFALGGHFNVSTKDSPISNARQIEAGAEFTRTCYESYAQMPSKIGPETFLMDSGDIRAGVPTYLLRPETVESIFVLWRVTGDEKYRDWGWKIFQAIEKHCKVEGGGYSGLHSVLSTQPGKDDFQQSFFLAETLKYLYLLFSPNHVIPLDKFVFNTEAHPLRITKTEH
ncbi:hypothetical protein C9374_012944 [Naegleria lovaniensis]|uniref:alpha-1,2-Mannosidase n=1 Tax=Naegleria lovaniensis TaxID=51637 RepID=A0AA88GAE5_NAELO|nr:uncharacterized protein C9374_012944 [Naegleria lovaniensis]KAG2373001.1 hypothetical protein C9374_012944 [Naegleria lovaniensis]